MYMVNGFSLSFMNLEKDSKNHSDKEIYIKQVN